MLFSIIVPVYNAGPYVRECLLSIEKQTFSDYELIVVMDEASNDESEDIVISLKKQYSNIHIYQGHHGAGAARNLGMKYANGDYFVFIDSDDRLGDDNYLQDIAAAIEKQNPDYVITRFMKLFRGKGREKGPPWGKEILDNPNLRDALTQIINLGYFSIAPWAKAVKRDFCIKNNLEFAAGYYEDYDWTSRIINLTDKYAFVNTPGVIYTIRPDSLSHTHDIEKSNDFGKRIEKWADLVSDKNEFEKAQLGYLAYAYYIYIATIHFVKKKDQKMLWEREKTLRYLRKYGVSKKCRLCNFVCNILGTRLGSIVLFEYVKRKGSAWV